ncbi:MAG: hypothetical protein NTU88_13475, partial [Armatimonadetes bacterium]|nr:hypothetical protein [Armatimonadota bacterium]
MLRDIGAVPRDVVDIHVSALAAKAVTANAMQARAYIEEGRLMVLELMGCLASAYRVDAVGTGRARPGTGIGPSEPGETREKD